MTNCIHKPIVSVMILPSLEKHCNFPTRNAFTHFEKLPTILNLITTPNWEPFSFTDQPSWYLSYPALRWQLSGKSTVLACLGAPIRRTQQ